jgi:hypothetical protein
MNKIFVFFSFYLILLIGCKKESTIGPSNAQIIRCTIEDYYTQQPLKEIILSFHVGSAGLGGIFGSFERNKYYIISDSEGKFVLENLGDDLDKSFHPEFAYPIDYDSMAVEWRYMDNNFHHDSLWIVKGINHKLKLRPAGITYFHHPINNNSNYNTDTIIISSYNQSDTITFAQPTSDHFHLLPSETHLVDVSYIKNGILTHKSFSHYISKAYELIPGPYFSYQTFEFNIQIPE